jgi:hypothetical protein
MGFGLITAPPFFAGFFQGINKRKGYPIEEPFTPFKIIGLSTGLMCLKVFGNLSDIKKNLRDSSGSKLTLKFSHLLGIGLFTGVSISGIAYYSGSLLARIPSKESL